MTGEVKIDYRVKELLAVLLRTRLTRLQARRVLGRSYKYYQKVVAWLIQEGYVREDRFSVLRVLTLTRKGRRLAKKVAHDIDPEPIIREHGLLGEYWYTLPELCEMFGVSQPTMRKTLRETGLGLRPEQGRFVRNGSARYRVWIVPKSQLLALEESLPKRRRRRAS